METERIRKGQERDNLRNIIAQWNANRLDLFELSEPNEDLEFHGVMRFYFQDAGQKVATKCIRVSSTAASQLVIKTLIEKFRPDMRMLSIPEYALYEIHENGEERKLADDEKPLLVQLNWHRDDREGRFLLRRMDEKTYVMPHHFEDDLNFKRKLSKREKKEKKKKEKLQKLKNNEDKEQEDGIAERLYTELPETSFTRSISNPEAVMRRRRQQKLEKKLQQFRSRDGGPDTGGTLKIYGESLCKDVPYKTLLLSVRDTAAQVVKEMLNKYGLDKEDPSNYCLVQSFTMGDGESKEYHGANPGKEYILDDDECPLAIPMNYPPTKGSVTFHIRRRPADYQPRKRKKKPKSRGDDYRYKEGMEKLPYFLELNPDGSEISAGNPRIHCLHLNVTEVGSERSMSSRGQYLQLFGPNVHPRHCVIAHTEGIVTVTPCSRDAETYVNNQRIFETTILQHGMAVRFGKIHNFRFIDPIQEERRHRHDSVPSQNADYYDRHSTKDDSSLHPSVLENSYDGDNVDTVSTSSQKDDRKLDKIKDVRSPIYERYDQRRGHDPILPAVLEFREDGEDVFLRAVISTVDPNLVQFKLAPTYTLYMAARYRASTHYRPDINPNERAVRLTNLQNKVAAMMQHVIQEKYGEAITLAFWMANASELLHFLKQDRHVSAYSLDAQDILAESVQIAFRNLVQCLQADFHSIMPAFLDERDDVGDDNSVTAGILAVLSSAMSLLRRCRVNAALTIQLFSQLFHFINMWLFNKLVGETRPNYCTRLWGVRLKLRLACIELWAEKQGLELAADCHLSRIAQAAHLLQSPKSSPDDISVISSTCFKLNSLQLRALLEKYQPMPDEPRIPQELIENVVKVAENTADELARTDGREVKLEEDPDLQLPFLLPEDGYSCDIVRGVPAGLQEFLLPLQQANLCRLTIQPTSSGYWTIYMSDQDINRNTQMRSSGSLGQHSAVNDLSQIGKEPEIMTIRLQKSNSGMGLSIVAAKGVGQDKLGIYIKSVVKGGAADADGRLQAGDQLLKVDGQSLVGITQERAAEYMTRTGPTVTLEVAKQGAIYHGLATLLNQPSPIMQRASMRRYQPLNEGAFENASANKAVNSYPSPSLSNNVKSETPKTHPSVHDNGWCSLPNRHQHSKYSNEPLPSAITFHASPNNSISSSEQNLRPACLSLNMADSCSQSVSGSCDSVAYQPSSSLSRGHSDDAIRMQRCSNQHKNWETAGYNPALHAYKFSYVPLVNPLRPLRPPKANRKLPTAAISTNTGPLPANRLGNPSARRSERDLPSRIAREQVTELDPRYMPRIQGSKSVPSLNSDNQMPESARTISGGNLKAPQEIFNPGYSRTSSTASIVKSTEQASPKEKTYSSNEGFGPDSQRNRADNEERFYQNISMYQQQSPYGKINENYVEYPLQRTPTSPKSPRPYEDHVGGDVSQPVKNFQQAQPQHPVKQHPPNAYQQPPFSPKLPFHPQYDDRFNRNHRGSQSSLHHPEQNSAVTVKERPLSALVSQRERDHFLGSGPPGMIGGMDERQIPYHAHSEQPLKGNDPRNYEVRPPEMKGVPQNARYPDGYHIEESHQPPSHPGSDGRINALARGKGPTGFNTMDPRRSDRNFLRQEAKMDEMREEVKRREERSQRERELQAKGGGNQMGTYSQRSVYGHGGKPLHNSHLQPPKNQNEPAQYGPVSHPSYGGQNYAQKPPPPPAPKPKGQYIQGPEKPQRQYMYEVASNGHSGNNDIPPERPPLPDEAHLYRDSPPPPPPPPASTHPLMQHRAGPQNGASQNHRYGNATYPEHLQNQYGPYSPTGQEKQFHNRSHPQSRAVSFDPRTPDSSSKNINSIDTSSAKSPSPWDREEREKERKKRLAEAHRLRDQEIQELESLQYRTPKQEERLRTLRLEQEFQRRAEELKSNDDDDDNEDEDEIVERRGLLRMMQEDLERNRLRRMEHEKDQEPPKNEHPKESLPSSNHNTEEWLKRQQDIKNQRREQREEERLLQQKLEEVQKKREQERQAMRELQAAKEAEERLLREAQRRQEEDLKMQRILQQQQQQQQQHQHQQQLHHHHHQQQFQHPPQQHPPHQHPSQQHPPQQQPSTQQLHLQQNHHPQHYIQTNDYVPPHISSPPSSNNYPPPYGQNSYHNPAASSQASSNGAGQRLDNLLNISSNHKQQNKSQMSEGTQNNNYGIIHNVERKIPLENDHVQTNSVPHSALSLSRNDTAPPKRVSFHDSKLESTIPYNDGGTKEKMNNNYNNLDANSTPTSPYGDDGSFSLSPNSSQTNSFATGNSPGVIGTQEIYRDPRKKIEAQRLSQNNKLPGPEKLSFKEKMKMFALETGDPDSPRDKVKISRAQREIETNLNGT